MKKEQLFSIGYHLNSWDLAGLPIKPALEFLKGQGFEWFEILAWNSLSDVFARKYMDLGPQEPAEVITDTTFLRRMATLSQGQREQGIRLSSLYCNGTFTDPKMWPWERDAFEAIARILAGFGAPVLVMGGGPSEAIAGKHTADDYKTFCRSLEEIGRITREFGVETVYHPHLDTFVETREQLDRMMDELDTNCAGLCIDPAHLVQTNSDPVDATRTYIEAIRYMHFKDSAVDPTLKGFDRYAAFCELGAGVVDLKGLADVLIEAEYDGLAIIELDVSQKTAEQSTIESIAYVTEELGLSLNPAKAG